MKKGLAFVLVLVFVLSLAACGKSGADAESDITVDDINRVYQTTKSEFALQKDSSAENQYQWINGTEQFIVKTNSSGKVESIEITVTDLDPWVLDGEETILALMKKANADIGNCTIPEVGSVISVSDAMDLGRLFDSTYGGNTTDEDLNRIAKAFVQGCAPFGDWTIRATVHHESDSVVVTAAPTA